jgi:hypothetical protein
VSQIGKMIAKAQITNGGPVILLQPENEYSWFPNDTYMNAVYKQYHDAGIVVPLVSNDVGTDGNNAPGKPAPVDIYGHDGYPMGFDCTKPDIWDKAKLRIDYREKHLRDSPSTPYTVPEVCFPKHDICSNTNRYLVSRVGIFQSRTCCHAKNVSGSFDPWNGVGWDKCVQLTDAAFERVYYKNMFSFGITIFNIYMV